MKIIASIAPVFFLITVNSFSQENGLINTSHSQHAILHDVNMSDVTLTKGFWAERFEVCKKNMVPHLWKIYSDPTISHSFENFRIAAGLSEGSHEGPPFHDGDFYKMFESMASMYAITHDPELDKLMDNIIAVIAKAQRQDGYIHTPVIIEQRKKNASKEFEDRLNFETYNLGHLMTAACLHSRATGKKSLLSVATKAADFLAAYYRKASPELARNAICPSHYMGLVELYRTTRDQKYLTLAKDLLDLHGNVENGTDHNQDRIPFRQQTTATGHAVRANYLYAGAADVFMETGDDALYRSLTYIWDDVVHHKMYITGACGALYDGVSPDATSYSPPYIQQVHQAYGRDFQLPNLTAHNESCANVGNALWNGRMFLASGDAKYMDVLELALYNSILAGISLSGKEFFYTNPLAANNDLPYQLRWSGGRKEYISLSNCCPPNIVRTIAEVSNYFYSISKKGVWLNLYGGSVLHTRLDDGSKVQLTEETNYPWDGLITITIDKASKKPFSLFLRIPGWCDKASLKINGKEKAIALMPGQYAEINSTWSAGDKVELNLTMPAKLMEANPLVEETRNQVAIKRGPIIYCLESPDLQEGKRLKDISIPASVQLVPEIFSISGFDMMSLKGDAVWVDNQAWKNQLYREVNHAVPQAISIRLIPYYAWANRGKSEMAVWLPLVR